MSEELLEEVDSYADTSDQEILDARKKFRHYKDQFRPGIKEEEKEVIDNTKLTRELMEKYIDSVFCEGNEVLNIIWK